jgi:uncharacterized protein
MLNKIQRIILLPLACLGAVSAKGGGLDGESSSFLKSFAGSPVKWLPWGEAAMEKAKAEQLPVFLFVGAFTSELSGAMRRQTFANPKNADWLNKHFVCVLVDRDERPDVAALYQAYIQNMKQLSGWPLNVWLTPEFQPFEGATYLSPSEDWGAPGFLKLANQAETAWTTSPAGCRKRAAESVRQLSPSTKAPAPAAWDPEKTRARLAASAAAWRATFDPENGGYGDVPRSLEPELIRFMLRQSPTDRESALKTLRVLAASAVRDPLDGGFFRHAADAAWHIPYQQKTLADQARVALAYLEGAQGADAQAFASCARGVLDFALSRLALPDGTFASSQDATGDEFVGYYTWSASEIDQVLGKESAAYGQAHGVLPDGNVPAGDDPSAQYAHRNFLRSVVAGGPREAQDSALLSRARDLRPQPPVDTRATAGENGLMLSALSRAGSQLGIATYLQAARRAYAAARTDFLVSEDGTLHRFKDSMLPADANDYAALALGCVDFGTATHDKGALELSRRLLAQVDSRFLDPSSGAYFGAPTPPGPGFFFRPFGAGDPPSAESLAVEAGGPHAKEIAAGLSESLEESSAQAPGDQLLGLSLYLGH